VTGSRDSTNHSQSPWRDDDLGPTAGDHVSKVLPSSSRGGQCAPSLRSQETPGLCDDDTIARGPSACEPTEGDGRPAGDLTASAVSSERVALSAEAFEIIVKGRLTPTLVAALEGFEVSRYDPNLTYLVGWVPDQARLHFVLSVLRDLNVELKSVNAVESADSALE